MPLFICDHCGARDNTATGWYWARNKTHEYFGEGFEDGQALCAKCTPAYMINDERPVSERKPILGDYGTEERDGRLYHKWHNHFDFKIPDAQEVTELIHGYHIEYTEKLIELLGSKEAVDEAFAECDRRREAQRQEYLAQQAKRDTVNPRKHGKNFAAGRVSNVTKNKRGPGKKGRP